MRSQHFRPHVQYALGSESRFDVLGSESRFDVLGSESRFDVLGSESRFDVFDTPCESLLPKGAESSNEFHSLNPESS
jgi:hypothetical protein